MKRILQKILTSFLIPFSFIWDNAYKLRRLLYEYGALKKDIFQVPVISIGNLTFGGTGKTPFIIYLSNYFQGLNHTPVILTRGYKGKLENSDGIIEAGKKFTPSALEFGDEPLLIARRLKKGAIIVGKRRAKNLKKYFHRIFPDIVLLDDGFQHIQIYRSFNVVLFDATMDLAKYKVAPSGYMREGFSALNDADAIVLSKCDLASDEQIDQLEKLIKPFHHKDIPLAKVRYIPTGIFDIYYNRVMDIEQAFGKKVIAVAAIASPDSFFNMLKSCGIEIVDQFVFADHHYFTKDDLKKIEERAEQEDALILTSEKDLVKIRKIVRSPNIYYINIEVDFISGELDFIDQLNKKIPHISNT